MQHLAEALQAYQAFYGLTDEKFAAKIGIEAHELRILMLWETPIGVRPAYVLARVLRWMLEVE